MKGDLNAKPTMDEIVLGLYNWLCNQYNSNLKGLHEQNQKNALLNQYKTFKEYFNFIKDSINSELSNLELAGGSFYSQAQ